MSGTRLDRILKRMIDVLGSVVLMIILVPISIIAVVLILSDGTGGGVFSDAPMRVGFGGKLFTMLKFRTMVPEAHSLRSEELRNGLKSNRAHMKIPSASDSRVTNVGRFIRKTDIDEIPQLLNVLRGEMSLVGPRPYFREELQNAVKGGTAEKSAIDSILSVKPGITGLWQVSGRNDISFRKRIKMDAKYVSERTIFKDFVILMKTPWAVISRRGAW